ncbi:molecular chaperone [uncultured Cedecea sp.]|uniref:fimbrial biogenesis chaperone n=2 Tax=uncultured Cedecea sp. TaxID=988762 RepID=UPI00261B5788|nr:molecular chaperone [uncultured Cedecea sp.]
MKKHIKQLLLFILLLHAFLSAHAKGISLSSTRVIVNASEPGAVVTVRNNSQSPWLIRARAQLHPDSSATAPFTVTPPLFRIEPDSNNTVRILNMDPAGLPADRESVFYLSFLAIPASDKLADSATPAVAARVTIGVESVIKLFYRPQKIENKTASANDLKADYKNNVITLQNVTPWYQTLSQLTLNGKHIPVRDTGAMLAPFSSKAFPVPEKITAPVNVSWSVINDLGVESDTHKITAN